MSPMVNISGRRATEKEKSEDKGSTWGELTIHILTSLLDIDSLVPEKHQRAAGVMGGYRRGTSESNQCLWTVGTEWKDWHREGSRKGGQHKILALRVNLVRAATDGEVRPKSNMVVGTTADTALRVFSTARSEVAGGWQFGLAVGMILKECATWWGRGRVRIEGPCAYCSASSASRWSLKVAIHWCWC